MKANVLIYSVCVGVGAGITLGIVKITFHIPLLYLILPAYAFTVVLTLLSPEEFVNVAWDCGGVTTGPVTVPLVLALGLAFGNAVDANEGPSCLSCVCVCVLCVLSLTLCFQFDLAHPLPNRYVRASVSWIRALHHRVTLAPMVYQSEVSSSPVQGVSRAHHLVKC